MEIVFDTKMYPSHVTTVNLVVNRVLVGFVRFSVGRVCKLFSREGLVRFLGPEISTQKSKKTWGPLEPIGAPLMNGNYVHAWPLPFIC